MTAEGMTLLSREVVRGWDFLKGEAWQRRACARVEKNRNPEAVDTRTEKAFLLQAEFKPVLTWGRSARSENLLITPEALAATGVEVHRVSRGGDFTGHGPGQWTLYPVLDLRATGFGVKGYLRRLEEGVIQFLARFGVEGVRREGLTGVWAGREKIAAVGVAVSRWIAYHGVAVNITPEGTAWSRWIVPCGLTESVGSVGNLSAAAGRVLTMEETALPLAVDIAAALNMTLSS